MAMSPKQILPVVIPAAVGNGAAVDVRSYGWVGWGTISTFTAGTVQFQQSFDGGVNWQNVGAALTAVGICSARFDDMATHVRVVTTAGTPVGTAFVVVQ